MLIGVRVRHVAVSKLALQAIATSDTIALSFLADVPTAGRARRNTGEDGTEADGSGSGAGEDGFLGSSLILTVVCVFLNTTAALRTGAPFSFIVELVIRGGAGGGQGSHNIPH